MAGQGDDEIGVGGDTSVKWNVDVNVARQGTVVCKEEGYSVRQAGIAESADRASFKIAVKLPRGDRDARERFIKGVLQAVKKPIRNYIVFSLPIEEGNMNLESGAVDQIRIVWPSKIKPQPEVSAALAPSTSRKARPKGATKAAAKKKKRR